MGDDFTAGFGTHTQELTWASQLSTQLKPDLTRLGNHSIYRMCYQHPSDNTRSPRPAGGAGAHSSQPPRKGRKIFSLFTAITLRPAGPRAPRLLLGSVGKFHLAVLFLKALALFTLKTRVKARQSAMGAGRAPASPQEEAWKPKVQWQRVFMDLAGRQPQSNREHDFSSSWSRTLPSTPIPRLVSSTGFAGSSHAEALPDVTQPAKLGAGKESDGSRT